MIERSSEKGQRCANVNSRGQFTIIFILLLLQVLPSSGYDFCPLQFTSSVLKENSGIFKPEPHFSVSLVPDISSGGMID